MELVPKPSATFGTSARGGMSPKPATVQQPQATISSSSSPARHAPRAPSAAPADPKTRIPAAGPAPCAGPPRPKDRPTSRRRRLRRPCRRCCCHCRRRRRRCPPRCRRPAALDGFGSLAWNRTPPGCGRPVGDAGPRHRRQRMWIARRRRRRRRRRTTRRCAAASPSSWGTSRAGPDSPWSGRRPASPRHMDIPSQSADRRPAFPELNAWPAALGRPAQHRPVDPASLGANLRSALFAR